MVVRVNELKKTLNSVIDESEELGIELRMVKLAAKSLVEQISKATDEVKADLDAPLSPKAEVVVYTDKGFSIVLPLSDESTALTIEFFLNRLGAYGVLKAESIRVNKRG